MSAHIEVASHAQQLVRVQVVTHYLSAGILHVYIEALLSAIINAADCKLPMASGVQPHPKECKLTSIEQRPCDVTSVRFDIKLPF